MTTTPMPSLDTATLITWQDELAAHLAKLPDRKLADSLAADIKSRMRSRLTVSEGAPFQVMTADEIMTTRWPEPVWAVPGLLPAGLCILAGKAKLGKSWLTLQIAKEVAAGGMVLGRQVKSRPVLYCALEDIAESLQARMNQQKWPGGLRVDFMTLRSFSDQVGDLKNGGGERLSRQIEAAGYGLVVIDTLSRAVPGDQNDVAVMTAALSPIQEIALRCNAAVVLNDHHIKVGVGDALTDILGSTAKGAVSDTLWGLYRERGKAGGKLSIVGRRVPDQTIDVTFDSQTGYWQAVGIVGAPRLTPAQEGILEVVRRQGPSRLVDIAEAAHRHKGPVSKDLSDLMNSGHVRKEGRLYVVAESE